MRKPLATPAAADEAVADVGGLCDFTFHSGMIALTPLSCLQACFRSKTSVNVLENHIAKACRRNPA
jgi:hypothetical protein